MKTRLIALLTLLCVGITSCYDDSYLREQLLDHENQLVDYGARLDALETLCAQMNTNITSLQSIIEAVQAQDYITSVTPITEGDVEVGYTINFLNASPVTIYHGKAGADGVDGQDGAAGKDGHTPVIGVKKALDQIYYWTIDGEWLLDDKGNKVKAVGEDGKDGKDGKDGEDGYSGSSGSSSSSGNGRDGITPKLKIEADYWWVSYDYGKTWQQLGKAVSEGSSSGNVYSDSIFESVSIENDAVKLVLLDGETFYIPRHQKINILLNLDGDQATVTPGETLYISYTLEYATDETLVTAGSDGNYKVRVKATDSTNGVIEVDCPQPYVDGFVNITVSDGNGYSYVKCISFCERQMSLYNGYEYNVSAQGGQVNIPFDINFDYTVSTSEPWINVIETKAQMREGSITLSVDRNRNTYSRQGVLNVYAEGNSNSPFCQILINQASSVFSISQSSFVAESEASELSTTIVSSNGLAFNTQELPNWIKVSTEDYGSSYGVTIKVSQNQEGQIRSAEVSCYDETLSNALGTIKVVQRPYLSDDASAMIFRVRANFANNFTCSVPIYYGARWEGDSYKYYYPDCIIEWGDGTREHITSTSNPSHTYEDLTEGKDFEVKITGYVPALSGGNADSGITHVLQWGNTGLKSMYCAFEGNNRLESIPSDKTGAFAEVTSFVSCFNGCSSLTEIPEGLFANCPNVTTFGSCFSSCDGLTTLPGGLFTGCSNVTNFDGCFYDCDGLTTLPEDLFANCPNVTNFSCCFQNCDGLTTIPEDLFANCSNATNFSWCFYDCDLIKSIPSNLFRNTSVAEDFSGCFDQCDGLTTIPSNLFVNTPQVTSFHSCFGNCHNLTEIPAELFANCPKVADFGYCFNECNALIYLPEGLFANNPNVTSFNSCFYNCYNLATVPVSIFDKNRMVTDFEDTFRNCYNFNGESPYTIIDGVKYHLYERVNAPDYFKAPTSYYDCFRDCGYYNGHLTDWDDIPSSWK